MAVHCLEIERGDTLWVTAHDERGATGQPPLTLLTEATLEGEALVQRKLDADETLIMRAAAS